MTIDTFLGLSVASAVLFVFVYFPAVTELSRSVVSPYPRADTRKRFYAAVTDGLLVATSWFMFQRSESLSFLVVGAIYVLLRDGVRGQSVGKFLFGLVVITLETGRPATLSRAARRNFLFLLPGANVPAIFLEAVTMTRDTQGQRLGDRLAGTQVVEGFGARDLVSALQEWWRRLLPDIARAGRPKRGPVVVDP